MPNDDFDRCREALFEEPRCPRYCHAPPYCYHEPYPCGPRPWDAAPWQGMPPCDRRPYGPIRTDRDYALLTHPAAVAVASKMAVPFTSANINPCDHSIEFKNGGTVVRLGRGVYQLTFTSTVTLTPPTASTTIGATLEAHAHPIPSACSYVSAGVGDQREVVLQTILEVDDCETVSVVNQSAGLLTYTASCLTIQRL